VDGFVELGVWGGEDGGVELCAVLEVEGVDDGWVVLFSVEEEVFNTVLNCDLV